jgi:hypothetical protein
MVGDEIIEDISYPLAARSFRHFDRSPQLSEYADNCGLEGILLKIDEKEKSNKMNIMKITGMNILFSRRERIDLIKKFHRNPKVSPNKFYISEINLGSTQL